MKTFSVTWRDRITNALFGKVMTHTELIAMVNNPNIYICTCSEIWRG